MSPADRYSSAPPGPGAYFVTPPEATPVFSADAQLPTEITETATVDVATPSVGHGAVLIPFDELQRRAEGGDGG
jgi:hypothetical protein